MPFRVRLPTITFSHHSRVMTDGLNGLNGFNGPLHQLINRNNQINHLKQISRNSSSRLNSIGGVVVGLDDYCCSDSICMYHWRVRISFLFVGISLEFGRLHTVVYFNFLATLLALPFWHHHFLDYVFSSNGR